MSHFVKSSQSAVMEGVVPLHRTHQVSRALHLFPRERDRADYKGASLGHARGEGYHYFIHFLLATKVYSSTLMQRG